MSTSVSNWEKWTQPKPNWEPLVYTTPRSIYAVSRGDEIIEFARTYLIFSRGYKEGEPLEFSEYQKWVIRMMFEENDDGFLRFRKFLLLLPRKNGKSLILASILLWALVYSSPSDQIYSVAKSRDQARIIYKEMRFQVENSPVLSALIDVKRDHLRNKASGAEYRPLSADGGTNQGLGPSLVVADEIFSWTPDDKAQELYDAMTKGSADRAESLFVGISTVGNNKETLLGRLYTYGADQALKQEQGEEYDNSFGIAYWGASGEEAETPEKPEVWERANPNLAEGVMDYSALSSSYQEGQAHGMNEFLQFHLNVWVEKAFYGDKYLTEKQISESINADAKLLGGERIALGFDGSISNDHTALIASHIETGALYVLGHWFPPSYENSDDWTIPKNDVVDAIRNAFEIFEVEKFYSDPSFFQAELQGLAEEGIAKDRGVFVRVPQSWTRMAPMTADLKMDLVEGAAYLTNHPELIKHFQNSHIKERAGGAGGILLKKDKPKSPNKIDLAVASILANAARREIVNTPEEPEVGWLD